MYLTKTPHFIQNLFPNFTWRIPSATKTLYLTFDDGPIPEVTPWVVQQLALYNAQATFFCVGENIQRYPEVFREVNAAGHTVGNHTFNHLSGWTTENIPYFHNVRRGANSSNSLLFRPPYGRLKPRQAQFLQRHYQLVMWDVLSGDFDQKISPVACLENVLDHAEPGSIIVFHDSLKAEENLRFALPRVLEHFAREGYQFAALPKQQLRENPLVNRRVA